MEPWNGGREQRPTALQAPATESIDEERLIWDPEYRAEVIQRLKTKAIASS